MKPRPTRRDVIRFGALGAAASVVAGPLAGGATAAPAEPRTDLIRRAIPGTDELLPAIGLGTFLTFDTLPGRSRSHVREVTRRFWQAGGRVFDTSALYGASEPNLGEVTAELGVNNRMFIANKVWSTGEYLWDDSHAERSLRRTVERLSRHRPIDVMQCHSLVNVDVVVPLLHAWKREGRIRYLGVTHHDPDYFGPLAKWVETGDLDFVQVHYSIHTRVAEERVLPAAADNGVAVLVNMPLEKARLHHIVAGRPLPAFAAELGIRTWSQYFLKWILGNPTVTCALPATSNPDHVLDNVGAMRGPLPDAAMRARMLEHMRTVPGFAEIATMPWYPGKSYSGLVPRAQARMRQRSPWWPA